MNRIAGRQVLRASAAVLALAAALTGAAAPVAQVGDRSAIDTAPPPAEWSIPPAPVRSPDASMQLMELPDGFRVELVAAEPLVQDPISLAFDEHNRLWVLEWPSYNWPLRDVLPGFEAEPPPPSRLVVLTDSNDDGRYDRRSVFAEMEWPRGFQLVDGGVLVFALPEVVFLRDTNGDGKADSREVVYSDLPIPVNPHSAPSSPSWTLDNWTYGLQVDERLRFTGGSRLASPAGRMAGQWGMSHDDYGRLFFSYNQDHIRGSLVPNAYARRNPNYDALAGVDERIGLDNEVWPHAVTPGVNRRAQLHDDGRLRVFTANSAPNVYRGDQFPEAFRGNVFVGESAGRLIRRSVVTETDGIITATNAYPQREFLFSHDERFRPVFTSTGPDGALYVADMYRGVIEGHIFLTTFLRNQILDRGLHQPFHGLGRIYRIVHDDRPRGEIPPAPPAEPAGWVSYLAHPNGHWRDIAQRAIVAAGDAKVAADVRVLAATHPDPRARLHALWTLDGLGRVDVDLWGTMFADASPHVRIAALRVAEAHLDDHEALRRAALSLADDPEVTVRRQLLFTLGALTGPEMERVRLDMLRHDVEQPFVVDAFVSGAGGREHEVLQEVVGSPAWNVDRPGHRKLVSALATAIVNEGRAERVDALLRLAGDAGGQPAWRRLALIDGVAATRRTTLAPRPASLDVVTASVDPTVRAHALDRLARLLGPDREAPAPVDAATAERISRGARDYALCAACHQADGRGRPALAPPLAGTASVTGAPATLIDIVLHGRDDDPAYPSMPPLASLSDEQLASILTYIRQAWGNTASPVTPDEVQSRRRTDPPPLRVGPPPGFSSLFNGRDLSGWRGRPGGGGVFSPYVEAAYSPEERAVKQAEWNANRDRHWRVDPTSGELVSDGHGVHLATVDDYDDFELHIEWKLTQPGGITGIYLRSYPQVQLWDPRNPTAAKTGAFRGSGALWNNRDGNPGKWPLVKADRPVGEWNTLRVRMIGQRVWVWLNDLQTVDGQFLDNYFHPGRSLRPSGAIELQSHGTEIRFRNIVIREFTSRDAPVDR